MLYDELVPDGKYLAHYGIPKDQWSPAARAKYDREHGGNNKANNSNKTNKSSKGYNPTDDYRSQARNQQLVDSGRRQIERASDIITNGNNLRNYWHNGRFIKRNEATDAYLRSRGFDPNAGPLVATPKRPENRVNSGTRTGSSGGSGRLSDSSRKAAENKRNRSTRNGKNSKTWNASSPRHSDARAQRARYGMSSSQFRDYVENQRRNTQNYSVETAYRDRNNRDFWNIVENDKRNFQNSNYRRQLPSSQLRERIRSQRERMRSYRDNIDNITFNSDGTATRRKSTRKKPRATR